jgi:hypothetical protein
MEAFVRNFYAEIGTAASTGNVAPLEAMMAPGCTCLAVVRSIQAERREGRITPFRYRLVSLQAPGLEQGAAVVIVIYDLPDISVISTDGQVLATYKGVHNGTESVTTSWLDGHWLVTGVERVPS